MRIASLIGVQSTFRGIMTGVTESAPSDPNILRTIDADFGGPICYAASVFDLPQRRHRNICEGKCRCEQSNERPVFGDFVVPG